ncbi:metal-sensing transcriptional repressor [Ectothiorhodospiraceae bacterium WFHF3C12]|nr:metal-sensing transcriptional repressor [Ectothiorhodospiraceae bacterium WFHF3C12]
MNAVDEPIKDSQQRALMARLARIEGQIRGIRRMIEQDAACENVAQQLAAARRALNKCFYEMMACAIERDLLPEEEASEEAQAKLNELTRVLAKYG